jgi:hypothetical protein
MSIQSNTTIINSTPNRLYEWIITDPDSYNPTTIGVIATSIEQARNLLLGELERQLPLADGIAVADLNFTGPWTHFPGTMERLEIFNQEDLSYRSISRAVLEASIATPPCRVVPIEIGTTILFSALDG